MLVPDSAGAATACFLPPATDTPGLAGLTFNTAGLGERLLALEARTAAGAADRRLVEPRVFLTGEMLRLLLVLWLMLRPGLAFLMPDLTRVVLRPRRDRMVGVNSISTTLTSIGSTGTVVDLLEAPRFADLEGEALVERALEGGWPRPNNCAQKRCALFNPRYLVEG